MSATEPPIIMCKGVSFEFKEAAPILDAALPLGVTTGSYHGTMPIKFPLIDRPGGNSRQRRKRRRQFMDLYGGNVRMEPNA